VLDLTPERIREVCGAALLTGGPSAAFAEDAPRRAVADSRQVRPGDLFVGIPGERVDGGEFARQAIEAGAWGVLVKPQRGLEVAGLAGGRVRVMAVEDPPAALGKLARAWVDRLWSAGTRVVGITGSTGKTSTKDILRSLLEPALEGAVHASPANYNTEIGLPLAVLEAEPGVRALVLEMAMRGPGQIGELCEIAPPDVGVITNVGPVHLELLGTVEKVAEAKAELIAALPREGVCVVPATAEALRPHLRHEIRTLTFAEWPSPSNGALEHADAIAGAAADLRVLSAERAQVGGSEGTRARIAAGAEQVTLDFNFRQAHNLVNALAAIGAAHALGVPLKALAEGAAAIEFSELRGEEIELADDVLLLNDCYNANPISMRAALEHLAQVASERGGRAVAVLGEMAELGPEAEQFHREVGAHAARLGVASLVGVGELARAYAEGYGDAGDVTLVAGAGEAAEHARGSLRHGDVVLVKGSRSVGLERVAQALTGGDRDGGQLREAGAGEAR
jgi:UDP-N-acetylmuramoyl-tripeptide--D-alanyl-D-alanine ligase